MKYIPIKMKYLNQHKINKHLAMLQHLQPIYDIGKSMIVYEHVCFHYITNTHSTQIYVKIKANKNSTHTHTHTIQGFSSLISVVIFRTSSNPGRD